MKICRHKQSGFVFEADSRLAIDIGSLTPAEAVARLPKIDASVVSHLHPDHFAIENLKAIGAPVYAPADVVARLDESLSTTTMRLGKSIEVVGFTITPVEADHGPKVTAPVENFGLTIQHGDLSIYFVGDMAVAGDPPEGPFDVVIVPVGGGGFVFGPEQALAYIKSLDHRGVVVPVHDAGPSEPGAIRRFAQLAQAYCEVVVLGTGESIEVSK